MFANFDRILARRRGLAAAFALLAGLFVMATGRGDGAELLLRDLRDQIRAHPASGEIAIVEIDSRSLHEMRKWPWPRRVHAALIERLRDAGARSIAFDVDFSSASNRRDDAALAAALDRAGGSVVLAALVQQAGAGENAILENVPIAPLRERAFLAAVNVFPDRNGQVRRMPFGQTVQGIPRPSLAAMVAEHPGSVGAVFPIDYAIAPASLPRLSFVDVLRGRVPAEAIRGRRLLVGATAVELGDRYAVPHHGVLPGVVIQALGAETLLAGAPWTAHPAWAFGVAAILIALMVRGSRRVRRALCFVAGTAAILLLPLAGEQWLRLSFQIVPALAAVVAAAAASLSLHIAFRFRQRRLVDEATGLPNLEAMAADAHGTGKPMVVARIERFAAIAAGIGPDATANLVHRIADRLGFGQGRPIYRVDDSHLAWVEPLDGAATLEARLEGLIALMRSPVDCGRLVDVDLAFGIADPVEEDTRQQAANATLAADCAAREGVPWQHVGMDDEEADWHLSLLSELNAAMKSGQVWNAYQPKLDLATGRISGVEALVRWDHPARGTLGPDRFIPMVESHGRARDLTLHVLRQALHDAAGWRAQGLDLSVAINVSATLLLDATFAALLEREIGAAHLPPESVTLEVTESAAMKDSARAVAALTSWRTLGLAIAIDDYGTGQSSLAYLQTLPATELKIDRSFIAGLSEGGRNAILVRSTIAMAHELGIRVVAEGVEDAACMEALRKLGCDTIQGWHIARPMSAANITELVRSRREAA